jgi:hypothetical protein
MQLVFNGQFGRFAAFLVQGNIFLLQNRCHFFKCGGFYPVQPLKKNRFGIFCLFSLPILSL